jgi:SSS family solute:Na+ symporter
MGNLDYAIVFIYMAMMVGVGVYAGTRQQNVDDYYVGGRRQGTFSIMCLWLASWIGGASVIGASSLAYRLGITGIWYVTATASGCLLFGLFFAARLKNLGDKHQHLTYPDLIEQRYDSRTRIIATVTTSAAYIAFAAGQLAAAGSIIHVLLGWEFAPSLLLASVIVVAYTATGGYLAVTYTDWIQFILLLVGIVFIGLPIAISKTGSLADLATQLPAAHFELGAWGTSTIIAFFVSVVLSFYTGMDSFTRCFAARTAKSARRGAMMAAFAMLPIAVAATWLGLSSAVLFPGVTDSNDILTTFVVELFPTGLKGLVLVGILAAIMSTADICILTASANLTRDVYQRYVNPDVTPGRMLRMSIYSSLFVGLIAALLAWKMQDVLDILLLAFTLNSAALFLPTLFAVYEKKVSSTAAFWSICLSFITVIAWYIGAELQPGGIFDLEPLWPGLVVSAVTFSWFSVLANRRDGLAADYAEAP